MSGFFERMAQRAAGSETRWEIRPRALFEPDRAPAAGLAEAGEPHLAREARGVSGSERHADRTPVGAPSPGSRPAVLAPAQPGTQPASAARPARAAAARRPGSPEVDPPAVRTEPARRAEPAVAAKPAASGGVDRTETVVVHDRREAQRPPDAGATIAYPTRPALTAVDRRDQSDKGAISGRRSEAGRPREPGRGDHASAHLDDGAQPAAWERRSAGPPAARIVAVPDTEQLLRDHVVPALQRDGVLGTDEQIDLVARPHTGLDAGPRAAPSGRTMLGHSEASTEAPISTGVRPEVHVHIDRVEVVRAAPAAPPQPTVAPSSLPAGPRPPSRLDLYLEQREAGRR